MLATTLGQNPDISRIWNEERKVYQISEDLFVKTRSITQTTKGEKGLWTTALAAAVLIR